MRDASRRAAEPGTSLGLGMLAEGVTTWSALPTHGSVLRMRPAKTAAPNASNAGLAAITANERSAAGPAGEETPDEARKGVTEASWSPYYR